MRTGAPLEFTLGKDSARELPRVLDREWLETNGVGGWASSSVTGAHTRRYHGLLVAATQPPAGRLVLLSKLDETLAIGGQSFALGCNLFPGAVHPRGFEILESFRRGLFPVWEYTAGGVRLRKTVAGIDGENTTLVLYEVVEAPAPFALELTPLFAGRDYHSLGRANGSIHREARFADGVLEYRAYDATPAVFVSLPGASYRPAPDWHYNFEYPREEERGFDFREDLFTPGTLAVALAPGDRLGVLVSTEPAAGRDALALLDRERQRREELLARLPAQDPLCLSLGLAADQFVVRRGQDLRTVIAGYHWFGDWGRDTMIALPGLCLVTGRLAEARGILRAFAAAVDRGMLPNRFPDRGEAPEYNTVDASLWFFVAIHRYLEASGDEAFVADELLPVLRSILSWHQRGTRHGIHEDRDGLLAAGEPGVQLTWMDARVGDWVVTPRHGKPVEINALWYNALAIAAGLEERFGDGERAQRLRRRARRAKRRFGELFWNEEAECLFDCIGENRADASLRPNQILALSLPFPLLGRQRARRVLQRVEEQLLTPVGLRTLAPGDPQYRPIYAGGPVERDGAYHQGTVWPWLLGPYLTALVRLRGKAGRRRAEELLRAFADHLAEAGIATASEIFDADPPHRPRGCVAQAWSVAEVLRAAVEDVGLGAAGAEDQEASPPAVARRRAGR